MKVFFFLSLIAVSFVRLLFCLVLTTIHCLNTDTLSEFLALLTPRLDINVFIEANWFRA